MHECKSEDHDLADESPLLVTWERPLHEEREVDPDRVPLPGHEQESQRAVSEV